MLGSIIALLFIFFIIFSMSFEMGIFTIILVLIIIQIAKYFRNLELKREGKNIGKVEYYADEEYNKLLSKNNVNEHDNFCNQCGNQLNPNDKFCSKCGKEL